MPRNITATALAQHFHSHCDLQLWQYVQDDAPSTSRGRTSAIAQAHFDRGIAWEERLIDELASRDRLLQLRDEPVTADRLLQIIKGDPRDHFYIAGFAFEPPALFPALVELRFGLAKPDLVEVTKHGTHIEFHVIDAKSSKAVKTSHLVQVYFYAACLDVLIEKTEDVSTSEQVSIWLPQDPIDKPASTARSLLAEPLDAFLAIKLPSLLATPRRFVDWHLNPLCDGCPYEAGCATRAKEEGKLGLIPNLSIADARTLADLVDVGSWNAGGTDIEELGRLVQDRQRWQELKEEMSSSMARATMLLMMDGRGESPVLRAVSEQTPVATGRRSLSLPNEHQAALYISLLEDPSTSSPAAFAFLVTGSNLAKASGRIDGIITALATHLRLIEKEERTFHVFVWSQSELDHLHRLLIARALEQPGDADVRICIGALCDGAAALSAAFQPPVLSGALLDFLARKGQLTKPELITCLDRLGVEDKKGTIEVMRGRLELELQMLRATNEEELPVVGHLPKVCVLASEVRRLAALPVPGRWDLPQAVAALTSSNPAPTSLEVYEAWCAGDERAFSLLKERARALEPLLESLRKLVGRQALPNEARRPHFGIMDLCRQPVLRKLFFIQQVLSRLQELWRTRLESSPDATVLRFREREITEDGRWLQHFDIISSSLDAPTEGSAPFFDQLLAPIDASEPLPSELRFDDLAWCSARFPLNKHQRPKWTNQTAEAQRLMVAQVYEVGVETATLLTYGSTSLVQGSEYRLSARLVDFNYQRILRNLLDIDLACDQTLPPVVRLLSDPASLGSLRSSDGEEMLERERRINATYRELSNLGNADANALLLKASQRKACRRMLESMLTIVWGPPGSGKSYTLALSLLRLIQVEDRHECRLIYVSAMTHAAIDAVRSKIDQLIAHTRAIPNLDHSWLDRLSVEHVVKGSKHAIKADATTRVLCGTAFQLYAWTKRSHALADVILLDESGQLALVVAVLVLASLREGGKLVVAGDHEQLAPIFASIYPSGPLTGSILDLLVSRKDIEGKEYDEEDGSAPPSQVSAPSTVVQLSENFRLNADLSAFVELIYRKRFRPQKTQAARTAEKLLSLTGGGSDPHRLFLSSLGEAMLGRSPAALTSPSFALAASTNARPVSLAMLTLTASSSTATDDFGLDLSDLAPAEAHIRAEGTVVAQLVSLIREAFGDKETIFVACPHRAQRAAVNEALKSSETIEDQLAGLTVGESRDAGATTVETVERLQGSEANFVIVTLAHTHLSSLTTTELDFLLTRRRLNVALSRSKTLCILLTSDGVIRPAVDVLARPSAASGLAFLRDYEARAWRTRLTVSLD